jgi:3',5'-cyclic AMP phosphodiesterase CpdA
MRTIAHISDLHFGRHSQPAAEALLTSVHQNRPDLIVLSGDFTQRARHDEFEQARRFLTRLADPKLVVPGNHDVPLYNVFHRFLMPLRKYDTYIGPSSQPANFFGDDEIAVLGINTARSFTRKNGRVSLDQIGQIRSVLGSVPNTVFKVIVTHHPLAIPTGEARVQLAGRAARSLKAIEQAGVHLLLSGHHHRAVSGHTAEVGDDGLMLVLHAGTAISTRVRGGEGNTYNLVRVVKDCVAVRIMEWMPNTGFQQRNVMGYAFENGRWRPGPGPTR